jgi:hypothetical protein
MSLIGTILRMILERSSRNLTYEKAIDKLRHSGESIANRFGNAPDTPANRKQARHIIGIERWSQHRLGVAQGEALVVDEYDSYCPDEGLSMAELRAAFDSTRQETLALVQQLQNNHVPLDKKIFHNDAQDLSLRSWFGYLNGHASRESLRVR